MSQTRPLIGLPSQTRYWLLCALFGLPTVMALQPFTFQNSLMNPRLIITGYLVDTHIFTMVMLQRPSSMMALRIDCPHNKEPSHGNLYRL